MATTVNSTNKLPRMYDLAPYFAAGIDPKTGLPIKMGEAATPLGASRESIYQAIKVVDEQNAITRYTWRNLPKGLNGELIERILYYRGQLMLFKLGEQFYSLPFCLTSDGKEPAIDVYGRYNKISPLPFNGTAQAPDGDKSPWKWLQGLQFDVYQDAPFLEEWIDKDPKEIQAAIDHSAVILRDYTEGWSQYILPRERLNDGVVNGMSLMLPYMQTSLLAASGIHGMRVGSPDESRNVEAANAAFIQAAENGTPYVPIIGAIDFQELTGGSTVKPEEYLLAMQGMDNLRLSFLGLDNGGLFQKKSHMLEAEQEMNQGVSALALENGLRMRQKAATIFNTIHGTVLWPEISESTIGQDRDGDLVAGSDGSEATQMKQQAAAQEEQE